MYPGFLWDPASTFIDSAQKARSERRRSSPQATKWTGFRDRDDDEDDGLSILSGSLTLPLDSHFAVVFFGGDFNENERL